MCGGVGSRFWPFSRNDKPKQFLDFFGTGKSLLQLTVERILPVVGIENVILVTNRQYRDIIIEQLPGVKESNILLEPARRNTAPASAGPPTISSPSTRGLDRHPSLRPSRAQRGCFPAGHL